MCDHAGAKPSRVAWKLEPSVPGSNTHPLGDAHVDILLRMYAEWRGRRKAAQIIIFDGAAEIDKTRSFLRGALTGIAISFVAVAILAPSTIDPAAMDELQRREALVHDANARAAQAVALVDVCMNTAQGMEQTLKSYQQFLGGR